MTPDTTQLQQARRLAEQVELLAEGQIERNARIKDLEAQLEQAQKERDDKERLLNEQDAALRNYLAKERGVDEET